MYNRRIGTVPYLFYNFFFSCHKNIQVGSGSGRVRNKLAPRIRISNSGLRIHGSTAGSENFLRIPKTEFELELADLCVRCMRTKLKMARCLVISWKFAKRNLHVKKSKSLPFIHKCYDFWKDKPSLVLSREITKRKVSYLNYKQTRKMNISTVK